MSKSAKRRMLKAAPTLLNGQWLGRYTGSAPGTMMLNLDDLGDCYAGSAFINPDQPPIPEPPAPRIFIPTTAAFIRTTDKAPTFSFPKLELFAINPQTLAVDTVENVRQLVPGADIPQTADVKGQLRGDVLTLTWETDRGLKGTAELPRSRRSLASEYKPLTLDWKRFKAKFSTLDTDQFIFRGQTTQARLCSKFHRTGRADLGRFLNQDIATLHKRLSARTRHVFRLEIPDENGAFFNLAQHHGYPTPLLDWTLSPYVAAFFAYRGISSFDANSAKRGKKVRIFVFDRKKWHKDYGHVFYTNGPHPHFTITEFIAIDNERMIPQQAVSSVTNVDDIESYIKSKEVDGKSYLQIIDLPVRERDSVLRELSVMGITAGSLFPGLDGACEELRERFFQR